VRRMVNRTPLSRFSSPSALARHVARLIRCVAIAPALPLRRLTAVAASSFALMLRSIMHPRTAARPGLSMRLYALAEMARPTLRGSTPRVLAGTPRRSRRASAAFSDRAAPVRAGHAPAATFRAGVPLPSGDGSRGLVGSPFGGEAFLGFRPVIVAGARLAVCHACDGVAFDAFAPDGARGVSEDALRRFAPAGGRGRVVHSPGPTCRLPIHRSQWFGCATGRPG
jgi:hypothetical protein